MPYKAMITAVAQASALSLLAFVVQYYVMENAFGTVKDFQDAYKADRNTAITREFYEHMEALPPNATSLDDIKATDPEPTDENSLFSKNSIGDVVGIFVFSIVRYYWLIWLERLLPARSRSGPALPAEKEDEDSREEEVIRKWVEAGKVRRASLNWCNTLLKWILDLTVGNFLHATIQTALGAATARVWPPEAQPDSFLFTLSMSWITSFVGIAPFATLIGFILVPAQNRVVFEAGAHLAWTVFYGVVLHVMVPWVMDKPFFQEVLRNMTDAELPKNATAGLAHRLDEEGVDEL